ncbi:tRNA (guanine(37)-N1)-methyltransferase [Eurosta solidaginis]|uniref:tRNA (guanine(37)-N1)-methyltransferase n=1 Tax=Eurosta solidaginis TaxID=178769 RepID=UPI0035307522
MVVPWRNSSALNFLQQLKRKRHYLRNMDSALLQPPANVRGMLELNRDEFKKHVKIPHLKVNASESNKILPLIKTQLLKMERLRPVRECKSKSGAEELSDMREILLHPLAVKKWECLPIADLLEHKVGASNFYYSEIELGYENWRADEIFKSVLPANDEGLTSYSRIGHIVHLNLRDHLLPYKKLIGQVLLDKVAGCRTVVNKAATIDNTYRNFQLELICGVAEYQVETKENGVAFEFDFARVYWNPRLSTEHDRITNMLNTDDVLYDVFAGVGPFSVPAARKRCWVLANDLNPESYKWLQHNGKRNKCLAHMKTFNKDGREFLLVDVKQDLLQRWLNQAANKPVTYRMHITMNLPAMAVEFLDAFRGLFNEDDIRSLSSCDINYPTVHVYSFAKGEDTKALVRALVEDNLGMPLKENLEGIYFVRNVAPNKDMYRVSFRLTKEILVTSFVRNTKENSACDAPDQAAKKRTASVEQDEEVTIANKLKSYGP